MAELTVDQQRAIAIARARRLREEQGSGPETVEQAKARVQQEYDALPWYGKIGYHAGLIKPEYPPAVEGGRPTSPHDWSAGTEAMDFATGGLSTKANAGLIGLIDSGVNYAQGDGWNYSDNYNKALSTFRENQRLYNEENPIRSTVGKGAGLGLAVTQFPVFGSGYTGAAGTGAAYGALMGAGQDAESLPERAQNAVVGGLTGGGIGAAGYGLGSLAAAGANKVSRAWQAANADPQTRAAMQLRGLADDAGGIPSVSNSLNDLGPDAMLVDVLGEPGLAVGRQSANLNPAARQTLEAPLLGRKAGQNQRIVADMERISGLPIGSRATVDDLVEASGKKFAPEIGRAYTSARIAGKDMPLQFFDDVLGTPQGKAAFNEAKSAVVARARLAGTPEDVSNLAIIDEMKKVFDSKASSAFQSGDKAAGGLWADFARNLRTRADAAMDMVENPIYAEARGLHRYSKEAENAIRLGEELAGSRVPLNVPKQVEAVDLGNRQRVAQGYTAKKADTLLNRGSTEGALNELSTPMGREAAEAALGPGSLKKTVDREKAFNQTVRALTGNSTTARQMLEMGMTGLGTGTAMSMLTGDPFSGGMAGILAALARKGGPAIAKKLATDAQMKTAPIIAEMLTSRNFPAQVQKLAPGTLEKLAKAGDDKLVKALLLIAADQQKAQPKPAGAR